MRRRAAGRRSAGPRASGRPGRRRAGRDDSPASGSGRTSPRSRAAASRSPSARVDKGVGQLGVVVVAELAAKVLADLVGRSPRCPPRRRMVAGRPDDAAGRRRRAADLRGLLAKQDTGAVDRAEQGGAEPAGAGADDEEVGFVVPGLRRWAWRLPARMLRSLNQPDTDCFGGAAHRRISDGRPRRR